VRIKSYYAAGIEAAMAKAGQDLGPEAVLITSRRTTAESRHLGEYEVVFGLIEDPDPSSSTVHAALDRSGSDLAKQVEAVRLELESMRRTISMAWRGAPTSSSAAIAEAEALLKEADAMPELCEHLLRALDTSLREEAVQNQAKLTVRDLKGRLRTMEAAFADTGARVARLLRHQLESMLEFDSELGNPGSPRRIVALVGPPGAGKTCTLVKLAVEYGLRTRRPSMLVSTDAYRIDGAQQLQSYAATIGMAFQSVENSLQLGQLLEEHRGKEIIFIDTPGFAPADLDAGADLARFLALHPDIQVHLVMPATMRHSDVARTAQRFSKFGASKLIVTKLDETAAYGAVISQSILASLPISFTTHGQRIPDDICRPSKETLLHFLGHDEAGYASSAA
jgi:flagellar biosynthesis protein FlhF